MLKYFFSFCIISLPFIAPASPKVPSHIDFAGIRLSISEGARKQIQADVDALHRSQTYFKRKLEIVDLYFPIIERVFREENLPDDFKYLAIQESALIPDAVSSSNAVGFWQFKAATAIEVGLTVNKQVDERMHITAASHGAARYLKKNNFYFKNWIYALLAYNTGPGGANRHVEKKHFGKNKMEITKHTHWYVKKFLAYKIAFENEIHKNNHPALQLYEYENIQSTSLREIANQFHVDPQTIVDYNKWVRKGKIPADKTYLVIIPISPEQLVAQNRSEGKNTPNPTDRISSTATTHSTYKSISAFDFDENQDYPKIDKRNGTRVNINGIPGFIAPHSDNLNFVTAKYGVSISKFLKYNDMIDSETIRKGSIYYLKRKKSKAKTHYHVVQPGETAWSISQKYGVKIKKLLIKNRMREEKDLDPGMVLWLRFIRPADVPVTYKTPKASNVVVKSIPNTVDYPLQNSGKSTKTFFSGNKTSHSNEDSEYLFEEKNDLPGSINDNDSQRSTHVSHESKNSSIQKETLNQKTIVKKSELYHIVKSNETLFSISRAYGVSVEDIRQWNGLNNSNILHIGQKIVINNPTDQNVVYKKPTSKSSPMYYTVKSEDTLYGIARIHEISVKQLMKINKKEDFNIKEGEVLKVRIAE